MAQTVRWTRLTVLVFGMAVLPSFGGGCTQPQQTVAPAPGDFQTTWQASLEILKEYQFEIDRHEVALASQVQPGSQDPREGLITTFPMTGKSWFEFWRKDAATREDLLESTIQTIYRTATVRVVSTPDGLAFRPEVQVQVGRSSLSQPLITDASEAYDMFSLSGERRRQEKLIDKGGAVSQPPVALPDDEALAAKIQADIEHRVGKLAAAGQEQ